MHDCAEVKSIKELKDKDYQPNYGTPLYDAMGFSVNKLKEKVKPEDKVLVTILTDGEENASNEYNQQTINKLVEGLKSKGMGICFHGR